MCAGTKTPVLTPVVIKEVVKEVVREVIREVPGAPTMVIDKPLRSGQKIYARGADLVVLGDHALQQANRKHRYPTQRNHAFDDQGDGND